MEGHWEFLGGGGILNAKFLEAMYENKLEFPGRRGGGVQNKNLPWGKHGYFLELHITCTVSKTTFYTFLAFEWRPERIWKGYMYLYRNCEIWEISSLHIIICTLLPQACCTYAHVKPCSR